MTDYTTHADALFDPDAPILGSTHLEARDNLIAVTEGSPDAPPILMEALGAFTAGTTRRFFNASSTDTTDDSYSDIFRNAIGGSGTLRVKFDFKNTGASGAGTARILVNGTQVAIFSSTTSFVTTSTDVTLTTGSLLQIQHRSAAGQTTTTQNIELLTDGEEIMFVPDQTGVVFG